MEWMIDKKDGQKVELLRFLIALPDNQMPIRLIQRHFDWSKYVTLSTMKLLISDVAEFYPDEQPLLRLADDEKLVYINRNRNFDVALFQVNYMRESVIWQFMKELFNETIKSYDDFAVRNLTTVSTARNAKLQFRCFFCKSRCVHYA